MKKYNLMEFQLSSEKEQKFIEETILDGTLEDKVIIDGEEYLQFANPKTGESILLKKDIERFYQEFIYDIIDDKIKEDDIGTALDILEIAIRRFFNREEVDKILKKADIVFLKNVFVNYRTTLKEKGIDVCEYASILAIYQDLLANYVEISKMKGKSKEIKIIATAIQDAKKIIDDEVIDYGGLEEWIEKKSLTKKRAYNVYAKDRVLEKILGKDNTPETNRKYAELLLDLGFSKKDLYRLIKAGEITPGILKRLYNVPELKKLVKETVGKFDTYNAMMSFLEIREEDVLDKFNWNQVKVEELKRIAETTKGVTATDMALFVIELCKSREKGLSEQEIDEILESKATNKHDKLRAYFELAKNGIYSENKIIEFFEEEIEMSEDPYEQPISDMVSIQELTTLFSTDKLLSRMEEYSEFDNEEDKKDKERLLYFYYALLEANSIKEKEGTELIKDELYSKLKERVESGDNNAVLMAIELLEYQILDRETVKAIIGNEDRILDLYNNGLNDNMLLYLYSNLAISTDLVELVYEGITSEELTEKIEDGQIAPMNMAKLYLLGIIDFEQLGECDYSTIDWVLLLKQCKEVNETNRIALLYKNGYIDFEIIKELKEEQIISAKEAEIILNQLDLEEILTNGLTSPEGVGDKRKRKKIEGRVKKEGISLEDRDDLFRALGFNAITNQDGEVLVVADGSFKGYRVYRDTQRNFGVIVFENNSDGSSFIMHEAKAGEFIKAASNENKQATLLGSRSYWREKARTEGSVTAKMHSVHWGRNIIEAIVDTSSTFKFDDEEARRKYIKTETRRLCEEHKDTIDYIRLIKQEQRE